MELYAKIEEIFYLIVNYCILFIELVGVSVLVYTIVKSVIALFKRPLD